jgi:hypothetical protein
MREDYWDWPPLDFLTPRIIWKRGRKRESTSAFENNPLLERREDHAHPQSRKLAF